MARKKVDFDEEEIEYELVSKSEMKRDAEHHQDIGKRLTELNAKQWVNFTLSDELLAALEESKRLKQNEAKRRHLQYIGKLMRSQDIEAIEHQLDLLDPSSEAYGRLTGQLEQWRNRLIKDPKAMNQFIDQHPNVDRQHLRTLIRNASKEMSSEPPKPGSSYKKLFQLIKEQVMS